MQEVRIQERRRGDGPAAWTARDHCRQSAQGLVGRRQKNMANGPRNCMVTEVLQVLPVESVYEITHWLEKKDSLENVVLLQRGTFNVQLSSKSLKSSGNCVDVCSCEVVCGGRGWTASRRTGAG